MTAVLLASHWATRLFEFTNQSALACDYSPFTPSLTNVYSRMHPSSIRISRFWAMHSEYLPSSISSLNPSPWLRSIPCSHSETFTPILVSLVQPHSASNYLNSNPLRVWVVSFLDYSWTASQLALTSSCPPARSYSNCKQEQLTLQQ